MGARLWRALNVSRTVWKSIGGDVVRGFGVGDDPGSRVLNDLKFEGLRAWYYNSPYGM